jgi:hypothetical protein
LGARAKLEEIHELELKQIFGITSSQMMGIIDYDDSEILLGLFDHAFIEKDVCAFDEFPGSLRAR